VGKSLSFITPSGRVTLGNYIGALSQWTAEPGNVYAVADLHGITTPWSPETLRSYIIEIASVLLALGLDQQGSMVYVQSHVPAHAEMAWLLECIGHMGEFQRMTQFKSKGKDRGDVSVGLFTYPALMAGDILLHDVDSVPVGEDQKQHVELTRDLALRANHLFGPVFTVPQPRVPGIGARVRSLKNPAEKMSKSVIDDGTVLLLEDADAIRRKFMSAVTDSGREVTYDPEAKPGISNLLEIAAALSHQSIEQIAAQYQNAGYGAFKRAVAEIAVETTRRVRQEALTLQSDPAEIVRRLDTGRRMAEAVANPKLRQVKQAMGFLLP